MADNEEELIRVTPDREKAGSIIKMVNTTLAMIESINKSRFPSNVIKEYYEVVREPISIILLLDGYKCYGEGAHKRQVEYLKEKYREFSESEIFLINELRITRNKIAYDGFFIKEEHLERKLGEIRNVVTKLFSLVNKKLRPTREEAWKLVLKYNSNKADLNHYLESEAIMRALAERLGEDKEYWGMLGLLHDIDWGITKENSKEHLTKAPAILNVAGFDEKFISIMVSHGYGFDCADLKDKKREGKEEHALACAETVTGLIHAYALMRKTMEGMDVSGLKKKFKDKRFAAAIGRDIIMECEQIGLTLDEFLGIAIEAVRKIAKDVDLSIYLDV